MKTGIYGILILLLLTGSGCEKIQSYPPEPKLTYKSHKIIETTDNLGNKQKQISLVYDFVDGDGDLITELDSIERKVSIYSKQYALLFEKKDGIYQPVPNPKTDTIVTILEYADFMSREGQNKTQMGTIHYNCRTNDLKQYDTIKIELYVIDRALHISNTISITDLVLK